MDEYQIGDIPQVSEEEIAFLIAPFTEDEIKDAIFKMEHNKSSGPEWVSGRILLMLLGYN